MRIILKHFSGFGWCKLTNIKFISRKLNYSSTEKAFLTVNLNNRHPIHCSKSKPKSYKYFILLLEIECLLNQIVFDATCLLTTLTQQLEFGKQTETKARKKRKNLSVNKDKREIWNRWKNVINFLRTLRWNGLGEQWKNNIRLSRFSCVRSFLFVPNVRGASHCCERSSRH